MRHHDTIRAAALRAVIVVIGVSGAGKTTIGRALAACIRGRFTDADDLLSEAAIAKMAAGAPLTDADRWPWLDRVAAAAGRSDVIACSALRRAYRDRLAATSPRPLGYVELAVPRESLVARVAARAGHFMPAALLDSQLATLESLASDERGIVIDAALPPAGIVDAILGWAGRTAF